MWGVNQMTTTAPDEVARLIADIVDTLARGVRVGEEGQGRPWRRESLTDGYRWLVNAATTRRRRPGSSGCEVCDGSGWTSDFRRCTSCPPSPHSNVAGPVAAKADRVAAHLAAALASVRGAVNELQEGFVLADRFAPRAELNERRIPRTVTVAEFEAAKAAKARRVARGAGFGDG